MSLRSSLCRDKRRMRQWPKCSKTSRKVAGPEWLRNGGIRLAHLDPGGPGELCNRVRCATHHRALREDLHVWPPRRALDVHGSIRERSGAAIASRLGGDAGEPRGWGASTEIRPLG